MSVDSAEMRRAGHAWDILCSRINIPDSCSAYFKEEPPNGNEVPPRSISIRVMLMPSGGANGSGQPEKVLSLLIKPDGYLSLRTGESWSEIGHAHASCTAKTVDIKLQENLRAAQRPLQARQPFPAAVVANGSGAPRL
jgi:hypothetical protein